MINAIASQKAKSAHAALLAQIVEGPVIDGLDSSRKILCQSDEDETRPRGRHHIKLGFQEQAVITQPMARTSHISYPKTDLRGAADALLAALTPAGAPIAADTSMLALLTLAQRVALSSVPVMIEGPTGTGKEVLARFLHNSSPRADGPFVPVNCAAMPEAILEAMLFGHRKGAFTGASEAHEGFFRAADGGTLLLDEIGELPLALQSKLLRALQEGEVTPIGATRPVKIDVRVIACTNRHLPSEIAQGRFREDLFYRLCVFPLSLPALCERPADIGPLAFGMMLKHSDNMADAETQPRWIAPDALALMRGHPWPGNVRELENVMRRALLLAMDEPQIEAYHIQFDAAVRALPTQPMVPAMPSPAQASMPQSADKNLAQIAFRSEAEAILQALDATGGHRRNAAQQLGISERTLRYRLASMRDNGMTAEPRSVYPASAQ